MPLSPYIHPSTTENTKDPNTQLSLPPLTSLCAVFESDTMALTSEEVTELPIGQIHKGPPRGSSLSQVLPKVITLALSP